MGISEIVGIDLGTTKSVIGIMEKEETRIITDNKGHHSIPSLVLVTQNGKIFAGNAAQNHPERYKGKSITISSIKRMMGHAGETGWGWWKTYPQEVSAFILAELKNRAENYLCQEVNQAVIAIPSNFDINQCRATKEAAEIAGFDSIRLLNEATAAIMAYGFHNPHETGEYLVFDFGGGSLDISIASIGDNVYQVTSIDGNDKLGGDDFDKLIIDYILEHLKHEYDEIDLNPLQHMILREKAETAKIELSAMPSARIKIPGFARLNDNFIDIDVMIERRVFEQLSNDIFTDALNTAKRAIDSTSLPLSNFRGVFLIGGSSRIPFINEGIRKMLDVDICKGMHFDTCVAEGATIQAGMLEGSIKESVLLDAIPSSYGIEILNGQFAPIIKKNTTIPTRSSRIFSTVTDNQSSIEVLVLKGENALSKDNTPVASIRFEDIKPSPKGIPRIEFTLEVEANMDMTCSMKNLDIQKEKSVLIEAPYGLNSAQMNIMKKRINDWYTERQTSNNTLE